MERQAARQTQKAAARQAMFHIIRASRCDVQYCLIINFAFFLHCSLPSSMHNCSNANLRPRLRFLRALLPPTPPFSVFLFFFTLVIVLLHFSCFFGGGIFRNVVFQNLTVFAALVKNVEVHLTQKRPFDQNRYMDWIVRPFGHGLPKVIHWSLFVNPKP